MTEQNKPTKGFPFLLLQLVLANIIVAAAVTATLYWIFTRLKNAYFMNLMHEFGVSPTKLNSMFTMDVEQSLWWGILVALALGIVLSLLLTKALLRPISKMVRATEKIAAGDLSARSPALKGELGSLSWHLNHMASALEQQEEGRQQLLRDLSHELRTPLTNVKGYIEGLEDGVFKAGPEVFAVLNGEVGRLNGLIDDLSELSLSEEAGDELQLVSLNLKEQIAHVISAHKAAMVETSFNIFITEIGAAKNVSVDPKRMLQILNNVIANMIHYAIVPDVKTSNSPQGEVSLDWRDKGHVTICFQNWAEPIPKSDLPRLFDRFYRADKSRSGKAMNHGLGLAITRRLVLSHSGRIWAEQKDAKFKLLIELPT